MVKVIIGKKGTGKTKHIIEMVNAAASDEKNCVVCIEGGRSLTYDISYSVRLIDVADYPIDKDFNSFFAFVCGIYAHNFDVTHIFIDSLYKVCGCDDPEKAGEFVQKLDAFAAANNFSVVIMISDDAENAPDSMKPFIEQ